MSLKPFIVGALRVVAVLALLSALLCALIAAVASIAFLIASVLLMLATLGVVTAVADVPIILVMGAAMAIMLLGFLFAVGFLFAAIGLWILSDKVNSGQIPAPTLPPFPWPPTLPVPPGFPFPWPPNLPQPPGFPFPWPPQLPGLPIPGFPVPGVPVPGMPGVDWCKLMECLCAASKSPCGGGSGPGGSGVRTWLDGAKQAAEAELERLRQAKKTVEDAIARAGDKASEDLKRAQEELKKREAQAEGTLKGIGDATAAELARQFGA